jgi:hypothetical protein
MGQAASKAPEVTVPKSVRLLVFFVWGNGRPEIQYVDVFGRGGILKMASLP